MKVTVVFDFPEISDPNSKEASLAINSLTWDLKVMSSTTLYLWNIIDAERKKMTSKIYGYYSISQSKVGGEIAYLDCHGNKVIVTEVNSSPDYVSGWNDVVKIGELDKFLHRISYGSINRE